MAKLNIIKYGDETLRKVSREVTEITPRILTLLDDMIETMHAANGCGLAAPQVGGQRLRSGRPPGGCSAPHCHRGNRGIGSY